MEKKDLAEIAKKLYLEEGYSCSESVLRALKKAGWDIPDALIRAVIGLRAGIGGSGCVCGALLASVLAAGCFYGGTSGKEDEKRANQLAAELHNKFKAKYKSTCCRVLTRKYDFMGPERKAFCAGLVEFMISELPQVMPQGLEDK